HIDCELKKHVNDNATWNDFKISQLSSQHYHMQKRTKSGYSWIDAIYGKRASGLLYAGGTEGGLAVGIKDFWQKCPTSLAVQDLTHEIGRASCRERMEILVVYGLLRRQDKMYNGD